MKTKKTFRSFAILLAPGAALLICPLTKAFYDRIIAWDSMPMLALCLIALIIDCFAVQLCTAVYNEKTKVSKALIFSAAASVIPVASVFLFLSYNASKYNGSLAVEYTQLWLKTAAPVFAVLLAINAFVFGGKTKKAVLAPVLCALAVYITSPASILTFIHTDKYGYASKMTVCEVKTVENTYYDFTAAGKNGELKCRISCCGKGGWRLQSEYDGKISDEGAGQRLSKYMNEPAFDGREKITVVSDGDTDKITAADGSYVTVAKTDGTLGFFFADGTEAGNISCICINDGNTSVRGTLLKKEAFWGGGEHFDSVNQRGKSVAINAIDKWAETKGNSYMPIPLFISSRGSGFFMNRFERMQVDVDTYSLPNDTWQITVNGAPCDLYVYTTGKPADVLYGYSLISGFSSEPAEWTYGTIVCRYAPDFTTLDGILDMAAKMEENNFPWDAVIAEGFNYPDEEALKEAVDAVHKLGKKFMVWTPTGRPYGAAPEGLTEDMYVKRADNGSTLLPQAQSDNPVDAPDNSTAQYIDVTNNTVKSFWFDNYWHKLTHEIGIDGAKIDFCEQFPDFIELDLTNGETSGMHHLYPVLYNTYLANVFFSKDTGGMSFARGGGIGAQRYSYIWMGDQTRDYRFLPAVIKGVISSGISGVPFTSYDMAGYQPGRDDEAGVLVRGVEFTAFTANIQTHGTIMRPYDFPDDIKNIYGLYANLHEKLRPYLVEQGKISAKTGMPLIQHLALQWHDDENVWDIEDEYMLGDALLVAPVTDKGFKRDIYLPEGNWINIFDGKTYEGGTTLKSYSVPFTSIPVFVKAEHSSAALNGCLNDASDIINSINELNK